MRHDDRRNPEIANEHTEEIEEARLNRDIETPGGLVHENETRLGHQNTGDRKSLLHAARKLPGKAITEAGEADRVEELFALRAVFILPGQKVRAIWLDNLKRQHEIVDHRSPRQKI